MKNKSFLKSLLSLALAVILTASVCVCGFSVAAETDTTVNFFDGTVEAPFIGTDGALNASAGITGILEDKEVARLVPQYAYDGRRQISLGSRTLEEGEIDYDTVNTFYLYIKNDLGEAIKWRMSEYADTNANLGTTYHNKFFTTGTEYWMVDISDKTAKKYSYTQGNKYIYIPKDFDGYIAFDLSTCDPENLAEFFACNLDHLFFWMEGFTEETVGNSFYYGDMNITTAVAEDVIFDKANIDYIENVCLNPLTDSWTTDSKASRYIYRASSDFVDNEYIGQSIEFESTDSNPTIKANLFTADDNSYNCNAIVFSVKLPAGATFPKFKIAQSKSKNNGGYQYAHIKGDWTTVNLINDEIAEYSKTEPSKITVGEEGFEGYLIFHLNENLTIPVPADDISGTTLKSPLSWTDFLDTYYGYEVNIRLALAEYLVDGVTTINLGEISVVEDVDNFIFRVSANENIVYSPANEGFTAIKNLTTEIKSTETIGDTVAFTYDAESGKEGQAYFQYISVDESFKNYEAMVFKMRITNKKAPGFVLGGQYNYFKTKYITVNTITGAVKMSDEITTSATITDDVFEGYIIAVIDEDTRVSSSGDKTWDEIIDTWYASNNQNFRALIRSSASASTRFDGWQLGDISFVKDLDEFLAPFATEEDPNQNVVVDPVKDGFNVLNNLTTSYAKADNIGNTVKFDYDDTSEAEGMLFTNHIKVDDSFKDYTAMVFEVRTTNKFIPSFLLNGTWAYFKTKYITVNTINGAINRSEEIASNAKITDDVFEGYVIALIDEETTVTLSNEDTPWADAIDKWMATSNQSFRIALRQSVSTSTCFEDWQLGEISFVSDVDKFIDKVTKPDIEGDANLDGEADVRDLVTMKKSIAGIKDIKINAFNVKFDNIGSAVAAGDLTSIRKMLMDIDGWKPTFNEVGMAIWAMSDVAEWDKVYGDEYGYANELFNYATARNIEGMKANIENGSVGWMKINNPFEDLNTNVMSEKFITNLNNKINGFKKAGVWDGVVGFYTEEIRGKMTDEQYKILTKYLKDNYPGKRIMAVLAIEHVIGTVAMYENKGQTVPEDERIITPANYDTYQYTTDIAYDNYSTVDRAKYEYYNETLKTNLAGLDYKKWYMPKAFWWGVPSNPSIDTEEFMIEHLELLFELLLEEENPGGLWLYGWSSYLDENGEGQVGLKDIMTKGDYSNYLTTLVDIALAIKEMN